MNRVIITYEEGIKRNRKAERIIKKSVKAAAQNLACPYPLWVSVVLTDNERIRVLNKDARGIDRATDVLSFPLLTYEEEGKVKADPSDFDGKYLVLGDMVLSLERAAEQAREYGHTFLREVGFLTVHSMLHLFGFDHMEEEEKQRMRKKEKEILEAMKLPRVGAKGEKI